MKEGLKIALMLIKNSQLAFQDVFDKKGAR